jgi:DNA mismatch repair ATPase MutS
MTAQSLGFAWAKSMDFVPLTHFETALAPADTLGRLSLFEAEIEFAKHILATADAATADSKHRPAFIIMDEIFHSTNAHDGAEASMIFLKQLYEKSGGFSGSLISTHYRELPDKLGAAAPHCMEAFDKSTGLTYTYRCVPGVSTLSSVREILRERGLLE